MTLRFSRSLNAAFFALFVAMSLPAAASLPANYSDLWWNPKEPGWGINISQQADTLFSTFFVYDKGERAVWYSVTLTLESISSDGVFTYSGDLYETSGPAQGTPYNPALVTYRVVGTAKIAFGDDNHGLLRYTADGVVVVKQITRQTFAAISPVGKFYGGTTDVTYNCKNASRNGLVTTDPGPLTITLDGTFATIYAPTCYFEGEWVQQGQIGNLDGRYECTNGAQGAITFSGLRFEKGGLVGNYTGRDSSCEFRGNIGGMRLLP